MNRSIRRTSTRLLTSALLVGGLVSSLAAAAVVRPQAELPLRLTSFTINLGFTNPPFRRGLGIGDRRRTGMVEIGIDRWSSDRQLDALIDTLRTRGANKMLNDLRRAPRVGFIRTPDHVGWDIHFASVSPTEDGGQKIVLATDRPIRFWEAANLTRTLNYPFTLIEIRLDKNGRGEGRMSVATRITLSRDGRTLELENYASQPVLLKKVAVRA